MPPEIEDLEVERMSRCVNARAHSVAPKPGKDTACRHHGYAVTERFSSTSDF